MRKPPVLNFVSSVNTVNQDKPFLYDAALNLNLIEIGGSRVPFVDAPLRLNPELYTKTRGVPREDDEEGTGSFELQTKTLVRRQDDYRLLELLTKTKAQRESDDE